MRRRTIIIGSIVILVVALGGALAVPWASRPAPMVGVVVARGGASLEATSQVGAQGKLLVDQVTAPDDSWVVVYLDNGDMMAGEDPRIVTSGEPIGYLHVPAGTSSGVRVPLASGARLTEYVRVVLQADRGISGRFEFDPLRFEASPDKPYYTSGTEVSVLVRVRFSEMGNTVTP